MHARNGDLAALHQIGSIESITASPDQAVVKKLMDQLGARFASRAGGYTRIVKSGFRYGDNAPMAIIEFVDRDPSAKGAADKARVAAEDNYES